MGPTKSPMQEFVDNLPVDFMLCGHDVALELRDDGKLRVRVNPEVTDSTLIVNRGIGLAADAAPEDIRNFASVEEIKAFITFSSKHRSVLRYSHYARTAYCIGVCFGRSGLTLHLPLGET